MGDESPTNQAVNRSRPSVLRPMIVGVAGAVLIAVLLSGFYRRQMPAGVGPMFLNPAVRDATTRPTTVTVSLRFGTFNMASGVGADGKLDLRRTANTLFSCDVVGLNEVASGWSGNDQPTLVAALLNGMDPLLSRRRVGWFAPSEIRWWHPHFGNGLLTTVPIEQPLWLPMPSTQERGRRNIVWAIVPMGDERVNLLVTHIDRQADQLAQLKVMRELFARAAAPAVLMGDFNVGLDNAELQAILALPGVVHSGTGYRGAGDPTRSEHLFVKGLVVVNAGTVDLGASDHPLVWADLALPKPPEPPSK